MTKEELDAIEARASAATPGPWRPTKFEGVYDESREDGWNPDVGGIDRIEGVADVQICGTCDGCNRIDRANGLFIAAARSDVPALVAEVRRLREPLAIALEMTTKHGGGYVFTEAALRVALGLDK